MGFIEPAPPPFDVDEWKRKSHLERIEPLAQDWALNGFGLNDAILKNVYHDNAARLLAVRKA